MLGRAVLPLPRIPLVAGRDDGEPKSWVCSVMLCCPSVSREYPRLFLPPFSLPLPPHAWSLSCSRFLAEHEERESNPCFRGHALVGM